MIVFGRKVKDIRSQSLSAIGASSERYSFQKWACQPAGAMALQVQNCSIRLYRTPDTTETPFDSVMLNHASLTVLGSDSFKWLASQSGTEDVRGANYFDFVNDYSFPGQSSYTLIELE